MASRITSPPERILRPLYRGVRSGIRSYRAAVCKTLKKPLIVEEMPAVQQLKNTQVSVIHLLQAQTEISFLSFACKRISIYQYCEIIGQFA